MRAIKISKVHIVATEEEAVLLHSALGKFPKHTGIVEEDATVDQLYVSLKAVIR